MSNIFLISDTHFGHAKVLTFLKEDGSLLRPGFKDIDDHDWEIVKRWNMAVRPNDKVYHLGDVGFKNFTQLKLIFDHLNGTKVLIKGNHDNLDINQYAQIFKDVRGSHTLDKHILSHIPIHPDSLYRWKANIHGHLHGTVLKDKRYINMCVEHWNYTPVPFEEVRMKT
jgi:calcineurin-like phosphoesterase family protein